MTAMVRFDIEQGVGVITLARPERLNAISDAMRVELDRIFVEAARDDAARVLLLTGEGRGFCAGADMGILDDLVADGGSDYPIPRPGIVAPTLAAIDAPAEIRVSYVLPLAMPKPVIAAVHGPCVGVGFLLAAACDVRFASSDVGFSAAFAQRGLPAEFGMAWLLPRLVGRGAASDLLLSGRRLGADEALRIGLVSRVEQPGQLLSAALDYARTMASTASPRSMRLIKRQLWDSYHQSFAEAAGTAYDLMLDSFGSADFAEGVASFREKRPPMFRGE